MQVIITPWKNIRNQVIDLHSKQSQNISKSTSKTNQNWTPIGLRGGGHGGALPLPEPSLEGCTLDYTALWVPWEPWAIGPKGPMAPLCLGNTLARRLAGGYSRIPRCILPDGPNTRGPLEVLVGLFTDFSDFLGRLQVIVEFYSRDYLFTYMFFFRHRPLGKKESRKKKTCMFE